MKLNAIALAVILIGAGVSQEKPVAVADRRVLSAFLGHWEGSGRFLDTKMSRAKSVSSKLDCAWSPQGQFLVCEQTVSDPDGQHQQITLYQADQDDGSFAYTTLNYGQKPFTGVLTISGDTWTYGGPRGSDGHYPQFRTLNTFKGGEEVFKTEFTEDGQRWTTMLEGSMKRTH